MAAAMPQIPVIAPMLVSTGPVPRDAVWELKWDGFRCCVTLDGEGGIRVATRTGRLVQDVLPELAPLATNAPAMVLDGELVAGDGLPPSFYRLASRLGASRPQAVIRGMRTTPVTFVIFDLLWLDGRAMLDQPYADRRAQLDELRLRGPSWATSVTDDDGEALLAAAAQLGAEGVVAKARSGRWGRYLPGARSPGWVKRKCEAWYQEHAPRRRPGGWVQAS
jgi:bifunctional non-homologous end joining protein LigD